MNPYLLLLLAVTSEVIATSALKATEGFTRPLPIALVVLGYGASFYLLSLILKSLSVGIVYAIWSGLGIVGITVVGMILFREQMTLLHVLGIGLIIAGVVVLQLFAPSAAR